MRSLVLGYLASVVVLTSAFSIGDRHNLASLLNSRQSDIEYDGGEFVKRAPQSAGLSTYVTNSNGTYLLSQNGGGSTLVAGAFTGNCNDAVGVGGCWGLGADNTTAGRQQTMVGFGAAITDTAVYVLSKLSASQQLSFLNDFFTTTGISLNFMRHTIGSSDLT